MATLRLGPLLRHVGPSDATVWVETDGPAEVSVQAGSTLVAEQTWTVADHHYALLTVDGLEPDTSTPYTVLVDGEQAWPAPDDERPPCRIRTISSGRRVRVSFGSCRYASASATADDPHFEADALVCLATDLAGGPEDAWPDALLLLGDQVYADETTEQTQERIRTKRDISTPPGPEVADFEEYTWLYEQSWTDPAVRWLLATVPSSMIFDDHDVRDDWNTSDAWRDDAKRTPWWQERIIGALSSYWVYQHLGNLSPVELAAEPVYQKVRATAGSGEDAAPLLRDFAAAADCEADGAKGARWSFRRELGCARLLMIDSRCGRVLAGGARSMVSEAEFAWISEQADLADRPAGQVSHLLIGTSMPWLLARALQDLESWNEVLCAGGRGKLVARWSEKLRRAADLEHWAAFKRSFDALAGLLGSVAAGERGPAPRTVCVLSGDVHHAYVAPVRFGRAVTARVYQLTCSPLHNYVPRTMKLFFRVFWSRAVERACRLVLGVLHPVPHYDVSWRKQGGPWFGNVLMTLELEPDGAQLLVQHGSPDRSRPRLLHIERTALT